MTVGKCPVFILACDFFYFNAPDEQQVEPEKQNPAHERQGSGGGSANLHLAFEDFADGGKLAAADGQGLGDIQYLRTPGRIAVVIVVQPYQVV